MNGRWGDLAFRLLRGLFRLLPLSESKRERWRRRFLSRFTAIRPHQPVSRLRIEGELGPWSLGGRALGYTRHSVQPLPEMPPATLVAFYLPQFHRIPENDAWWGEGFTEWTNVRRAMPRFDGHVQPRVPAELGYYDLRDNEVMRRQAALAAEYGIGAFCFYFYWFSGKTLLETPLRQWLDDRDISLPFCLCWANEDWTRTWDGRAGEVLIGQGHTDEDDLDYIAHIADYLRDPRYLRVDGKPLLLVYRPSLLPDAKATAARWRNWCREHGIGEICIANVQSFDRAAPQEYGFDVAVEFPPHQHPAQDITTTQAIIDPDYRGEILDWRALAAHYLARDNPAYRCFPAVNCGWDNEPRRPGLGRSYLHASPSAYAHWLRRTIETRIPLAPSPDRLVFINAWNEWAEGATLEPDQRLGHAWLQATRRALMNAGLPPETKPIAVVIHAWYEEALAPILDRLREITQPIRLILTTSEQKAPAMRSILEASGFTDSRIRRFEIRVFENRGRDILPFLRLAYELRDAGHDIVLKLHTKRSLHRGDGERWLDELLGALLPEGKTATLIQALRSEADIGLVAPDGHQPPLSYYWGANESRVRHLAAVWASPHPAWTSVSSPAACSGVAWTHWRRSWTCTSVRTNSSPNPGRWTAPWLMPLSVCSV